MMDENHTSRCADCWQEEEVIRVNTPEIEAILAKGRDEAGLIIEVVGHLRSRMGDTYTTKLGFLVEQVLEHVLYQRRERKESTVI